MGSVPPALVGNAASFHMTNAANAYQSNAACFHMSNAAQQGITTAVDQHQWKWTPWGLYPCSQGVGTVAAVAALAATLLRL